MQAKYKHFTISLSTTLTALQNNLPHRVSSAVILSIFNLALLNANACKVLLEILAQTGTVLHAFDSFNAATNASL